MSAALSVEGVCVTYGRGASAVRALDDVSLSFSPGQLALVMGPSGSGKTTLLSVLGCLLAPDRGRVSIMGETLMGLSEHAAGKLRNRFIGYVFQAFRLFRALSAIENILVAIEVSGRNGSNARDLAYYALETVGLAHKSNLRPAELSGGEKQRVAIARALVNNPPIVLADEPTASLDHASGQQIATTLERIAEEQKRTVVVVSHDPRWLHYSHRIVTMADGRVIEDKPQ